MQVARALTEEAGALLLNHFGRLAGYDEKSAINLVSDADRESERLIASRLRATFSDDVLCLEEADGVDGARARREEITRADFAWCVDPLDGTTNYVHTYPQYAVSIGLLARGKPILGVVFAPSRGEHFEGLVGVGASLNGRRIRVSQVAQMSRALVCTGFPYDRRERIDHLLRIVKRAILCSHDVRRAGAASLDLCELACGRLDAFFEEGLAPWDLAAGQAILEAAGGLVTSYTGRAHDLFAGLTLASNGLIHDELRALVSDEVIA